MKLKSWFMTLVFLAAISPFAQARYYDPTNGRFVSADTVVPSAGDPQSFNRYAYVRNSPTNLTDPSGNFFWAPVIIGAAIGAAVGGTHGRVFDSKAWQRFDWQYAAQGAALGAAGGAAYSLGTFSIGQFVVPGKYMAASVAIAGTGYVVDAYGGNVDTTGYSPNDSYQTDYRASRPMHPVRQYYPSPNELYAAAGMPDTGITHPTIPLWGLDPQIQVRVRTRSRSDDENETELYHYGQRKNALGLLTRGLNAPGFGTPDWYERGRDAQLYLAIPIKDAYDSPPNARYILSVDLSKTFHDGPRTVQPLRDHMNAVIRPGGGQEYEFPFGTPSGSIIGLDAIPPY